MRGSPEGLAPPNPPCPVLPHPTVPPPGEPHAPCICTRNSVLMRRAASLSFSLREPHSESTSSMKMMEGLCCLASSKRFFTSLATEAGGGSPSAGRGAKARRPPPAAQGCEPLLPLPALGSTPPAQLTSRSLPATSTSGLRTTRRRRWSCWLRWPQPWPGRTCQCQGAQRAESLARACASLRQSPVSKLLCRDLGARRDKCPLCAGSPPRVHMPQLLPLAVGPEALLHGCR